MRQYSALGLVLCLISAVACGSGASDTAGEKTGGMGNGASAGKGSGGAPLLGSGGTSGASAGTNDAGTSSNLITMTGGTGATNGGNGSTNGGSSGSDAGGPTPGYGAPVTSVTPVDTGSACASQALAASGGTLDIFIMLDKSMSMSDKTPNGSSKWDVITQAIGDFVNDPKSTGIEAGLGFFGISAGTGGRHGGSESSCTASDYAKPVVPIAALPSNAQPIANAIAQQSPSGSTPTEPALQGAINYASQWSQQNPAHKVIVVFATDGLPNGCNSSVSGAAAIAAAGVKGSPSIPTYVIGVFGDQDCPGGVSQGQQCDVINNTNQIANGGGTQSAFIVNASGDTGAQFLQALDSIRTANAVGCDFAVPAPSAGNSVDFSSASVQYTPGGGNPSSLSWVMSAAACDPTSGGWYYDSATAPNHMLLCDATCSTVTADPNAKVDVMLGCLPPGTHGTGGAPGAGGTSGTGGTTGASGTGGGTHSCLLDGQSCTDSGACCNGLCGGGICVTVR